MAQKHLKEKEKVNPQGIQLASIQWPKALKGERESNSLRIKTSFHSIAKSTKRRNRNKFLKD